MAQRLLAALGHHLDRQAPVEIGRYRLKFVECDLVAGEERGDETFVFRTLHRTIDVVGARPGRSGFVIARLEPRNAEIDRLAMHDWRDGVEKSERGFAA